MSRRQPHAAPEPPLPNIVVPVTPRIDGRNNNAAPMNTSATGVPTGTCVGLSLCCLNFMIAPIENPRPERYEPAVISCVKFVNEPSTFSATAPSDVAAGGLGRARLFSDDSIAVTCTPLGTEMPCAESVDAGSESKLDRNKESVHDFATSCA